MATEWTQDADAMDAHKHSTKLFLGSTEQYELHWIWKAKLHLECKLGRKGKISYLSKTTENMQKKPQTLFTVFSTGTVTYSNWCVCC